MTPSAQALVVGAGLSGLVCANLLANAGIDVQVLEASSRPGGMICSERRDEFLLESGPQSFSGSASLCTLCADLGIADQLVKAPAGAPRYVLIDNTLKTVPLTPPALLASSLLTAKTKWNLVRDAFGVSVVSREDESVAAFVRRKFGDELLDRLVGPFVSGIYAGDPERLSLRAAFPRLYEAEKSSGSVIRGMRRVAKLRKGATETPTPFGFRDGNDTLVRALAGKLGSNLRLDAEVTGIAVRRDARNAGFELRIRQAAREETIVVERMVLATPADVAGALLCDLNPAFQPVLGGIEYAPVAVVSLGYRREDVGHSLEGFGFLAPRSSGLRVLGSVWNSSLFPGRAPAGRVLLTSFIGGTTDPTAIQFSPGHLSQLVHQELAPLLQICAPALFSHVHIYPRALPQYNIGHTDRLIALEKLRAALPGLFLVGNYLRGPAIGNCIDQATATAEALVSQATASSVQG